MLWGLFACGTSVPFVATASARVCLCQRAGLKALISLTLHPSILAGSPDGHESGAECVLTPAPHGCPRDYGRVETQPCRQASQEAELVPCLEVQADEPARTAEAVPGESPAGLQWIRNNNLQGLQAYGAAVWMEVALLALLGDLTCWGSIICLPKSYLQWLCAHTWKGLPCLGALPPASGPAGWLWQEMRLSRCSWKTFR